MSTFLSNEETMRNLCVYMGCFCSQIFFRSGTLERLEAQRDEKLTGHIILLQARCRGYLARRKLNTLKVGRACFLYLSSKLERYILEQNFPGIHV